MSRAVISRTLDKSQGSTVADYISLLKPRVMSLVVFTGFTGLFLAPGQIHPFIATVAIICISLGSGAAGAINMWLERETDAKMTRTMHRPLPMGKINPDNAIEFAVMMAFASVFIMGIAVNPLSALLLLSGIIFYVFIYTVWLKPSTPQNIVIGGAAGAVPPLIGWVAVTDNITIEPVILFLIIFFWTPPHFWALSLYRSDDYARAGIPMMPNVAGKLATKRQMLAYTLILLPLVCTPYFVGMSGFIYFVGAIILGINFIFHAMKVLKSESDKDAKKMFGFSIMYLFFIFVLLILDRIFVNYAT